MWTGGVAHVAEYLLCKYEALSSDSSPTKKKGRKKEGRKGGKEGRKEGKEGGKGKKEGKKKTRLRKD
jgi:hypothetical protein